MNIKELKQQRILQNRLELLNMIDNMEWGKSEYIEEALKKQIMDLEFAEAVTFFMYILDNFIIYKRNIDNEHVENFLSDSRLLPYLEESTSIAKYDLYKIDGFNNRWKDVYKKEDSYDLVRVNFFDLRIDYKNTDKYKKYKEDSSKWYFVFKDEFAKYKYYNPEATKEEFAKKFKYEIGDIKSLDDYIKIYNQHNT